MLERNPTDALIIAFNSHRTNSEQRHKYTFTHFYTQLSYRPSNTTLGWIFQVVSFPSPVITEEIVNLRHSER